MKPVPLYFPPLYFPPHIGLVTSPLVAGRLAQTSVYSMGAFFTLLWACAAGALLLLMCKHRSSARRYQRGVA